MATTRTIRYEFVGDASDLEQAAAKSEKALAGVSSQGKKLETSTKKLKTSTKDAGKGMEKFGDAAGSADSKMKALAGGIGLVSPELETLLVGAGDVAGAFEAASVGGASLLAVLGPVAIAVGAAAAAYVALNSELEAAIENQREAAQTAQVFTTLTERLEDAELSLSVATGELSGEEAQRLKNAKEAKSTFKESREEIEKQREAIKDAKGEMESFNSQVLNLLKTYTVWGRLFFDTDEEIAERLDKEDARLSNLAKNLDRGQKKLTETLNETTEALGSQGKTTQVLIESSKSLSGEVKERTALALEERKALESLQSQAESFSKAQETATEKVLRRRKDELDSLDEIALRYSENAQIVGQVAANRILVEEQAQREIAALQAQAIQDQQDRLDEAFEKDKERVRALSEEYAAQAADWEASRSAALEGIAASAGAAGGAIVSILETQAKEGKKQALKAFRAGQGLAASQVVFGVAQASIAALAPPPVGLGPVFGPALATAMIAAGGIQLAAIAAEKAPKFHTGGVVSAQLLEGEAVLNRQATQSLGAQAINALNARPGSASLGGSVSLRIGRLEAREIIRTDLRAGGLIAQTARQAASKQGPESGMSGQGVLA